MLNPSRRRTNVECRMERLIVAVILLASVKTADAQLTRACCLPNGSCAIREPQVCLAQGGFPDSRHATCDNVVCNGACCLPNGNCAFVIPQTCIAASGTFDGFGSLCADVVCGGACCHANGSCAQSNEASCVSPSTFQGLGAACANVDCEGACCLPDGTCAETNEPGCVQVQSGEFLGLAATCPASVCTGACCLADKTCVQTGPGSCAQFGGEYQGRESNCGDECPVAMPTAFTYQGQLKRAGVPLNGLIDARFSLWMHSTGQSPEHQIGSALALDSVEVANGLFNVELDFGQDAFNGNARWLQIEIHDHADPPGTFTTLAPRQPLTPTPYALQTRGITVDEENRVGIGTKSPAEALTVAGNIELGTSSGDYRQMRIGGGNSDGFIYGSFPRFGDGIHMGYNYFADATGGNQVIHSDGGTSRLSMGYGSIALAASGPGGAPPVNRVTVDQSGLVVNVGDITIPAKLRSHTLHAFDFMTTFSYSAVYYQGNGLFVFDDGNDISTSEYGASLHLPDGATVIAMELIGNSTFTNIEDHHMTCYLGRTNFSGDVAEMARVENLTGGNVHQTTDILFPTIDNDTHAYFVLVVMRVNPQALEDDRHRLIAVRLIYSITKPLP